MAVYRIHPIVMGTKIFDKGMMTYQHDYGSPFVIPIYCWYLEGGETNILVDTGEMSPIQSEDRSKAVGAPIHTFEQGLAQWDLAPEDIDLVIHTHLHNDHCENDFKCINARFIVHRKEMERIHDPHPLDYRYLEDYIEDVEENGQIQVVEGDLFQVADGIEVWHTPAHTEGGLSVAVATQQGRAVITGCCTIEENFFPPPKIKAMEMEVIPPGTVIDPYKAYDVMVELKKKADVLLPLHEPALAERRTVA